MKNIKLTVDMIYRGSLILVNQQYPYREYRANNNLIPIPAAKDHIFLDRRSARFYTNIMDKLSAWNGITAISGWRSLQEQRQIYNDALAEKGTGFTEKYVAMPGHSEHQTGLAVDVALNQEDIDFIAPHFPYAGICEHFRRLARRFGFIERYPSGKEGITGIAHEPWHFRYVGAPHAMLMEELGDTLEEYHMRLKQYEYGHEPLLYEFNGRTVEISYLAADIDYTELNIKNDAEFTVSGNNIDGFIITVWGDKHWSAHMSMAGLAG